MSAYPSRRGTLPGTPPRGCAGITAALAAVTGGLLAWAAAVPAASASIIPVPARTARTGPSRPPRSA